MFIVFLERFPTHKMRKTEIFFCKIFRYIHFFYFPAIHQPIYSYIIYVVNKLDPHTLFSIFEQGDEEIYREHNITGVLDNPYVLIGMVVTGVENFNLIDKIYLLKYGDKYARVQNTVKHKYFNRLYNYLTRVNLNELQDEYTIGDDYEIDRGINSLTELLLYYQVREHYEKCSIVKKFCDLLIDKKLQILI